MKLLTKLTGLSILLLVCTSTWATQIDNRFIKDKTITASKVNSQASTNGQVLTADGSGNATFQTPSGSSSGITVRFALENAVIPYLNIDGPHYQTSTQSLTQVYISIMDSGSTGSTVVQLNQYRSGSLLNFATASIASSTGATVSSQANLSGTLSLLAGDVMTCDVVSIAGGKPESLSVEY